MYAWPSSGSPASAEHLPVCAYAIHVSWWLDNRPPEPLADALRACSDTALQLPSLAYLAHEFDSAATAAAFLEQYKEPISSLIDAGRFKAFWHDAATGTLHELLL